jgi:hypothetical protein
LLLYRNTHCVHHQLYFQHLFRLYFQHHDSGWVACCAGVLHTIMFNRSLGQVKPQDVDSELFDITYVSDQTALAVKPVPAYLIATTTSLPTHSMPQSMGQARVGSVVSSNALRDKKAPFCQQRQQQKQQK